MTMLQLLIGTFMFVTAVSAQENADPICERFKFQTLDELLNNPPGINISNQMLECLPRKLIRQFTEKSAPHVGITIDCLENPTGNVCASHGKGYVLVAEALGDIFRRHSRCFSCQPNHPTVDYAINLLQRKHPRLLQKGIQFLTLQD